MFLEVWLMAWKEVFWNHIVDLNCQLDWIWNHLGDTTLGMSVRVFSEKFSWGGKIWMWVLPFYGLGSWTDCKGKKNQKGCWAPGPHLCLQTMGELWLTAWSSWITSSFRGVGGSLYRIFSGHQHHLWTLVCDGFHHYLILLSPQTAQGPPRVLHKGPWMTGDFNSVHWAFGKPLS